MLSKIEELVRANYTGRDELYVAAKALEDDDHREVCRRLADHLAGHAAELQQILLANGGPALQPSDFYSIAEEIVESAKERKGTPGVLKVAEGYEKQVKDQYDSAINETPDDNREAKALLERQRGNVEFGEKVLRSIRSPKDSK